MYSLLMSLLLPHLGGTFLYKHNRLACIYFQTLIALHLYLLEESQPQGQAMKPLPLCFMQLQCSTVQRLLFSLLALGVSQSAHPLVLSCNYFLSMMYLREN